MRPWKGLPAELSAAIHGLSMKWSLGEGSLRAVIWLPQVTPPLAERDTATGSGQVPVDSWPK